MRSNGVQLQVSKLQLYFAASLGVKLFPNGGLPAGEPWIW